jgi:hypothetical protein
MNLHKMFRTKAVQATLVTALVGLAILAPCSGGRSFATPLVDPIGIFRQNTTAYSYYYHYAWYDHSAPPPVAPMNLGDPFIGPGIPVDQDLRALV